MRLPQSYLDQPRWWRGGQEWLAALPALVRDLCESWRLNVDGEATHGSHALVVPVRRDGEACVLRVAPPDDDISAHVRALRFWDGRGTVRLINADAERGAMLLERLGTSLDEVPVTEAVAILGRMMRRLATPAPANLVSTAEIVGRRSAELEPEWRRLGEPFAWSLVTEALDIASRLSTTESMLAVNGDLHSAQVLRGTREPWLTVDPVLMRGDIAYDLGRVLWTRLDDMADVVNHFDIAVSAAGLDRDHARDWVIFRTTDYWLWSLSAGLTEDPIRCARLISDLG